MLTQPHPNDLRDLYIKLNPNGWCDEDLEKDSLGFVDPHTSQDFNSFRAGHQVGQEDNERLTAERDALQQRLNAVEEENDRLRSALKFYADGEHYHVESDRWDTVSGEPLNMLWHDEEPDFIEDGTVARTALENRS